MCRSPRKHPLLALLQHMNRFECANSLVLSAALITLCINRRMPTTISGIPVTCCQVTTCYRKKRTIYPVCIHLTENEKYYTHDLQKVSAALVAMAYVRIASSRGCHLAVASRSRAPAFLCASPGRPMANDVNLQEGCFSPNIENLVREQQRHYSSVGGVVKKAGTGWLRRQLYTILAVAGLSGGALVFVSLELQD